MRLPSFMIAVIWCIVYGCAGEKEMPSQNHEKDLNSIASSQVYFQTERSYQSFPSYVSMADKSVNQYAESQRRRDFLKDAGLPDATEFATWKGGYTLSESIALYKKRKDEFQEHTFINTFKQYGSWIILTKMDLLSTNRIEDILYFTNELIDAEYGGMQLLAYAIQNLSQQGINSSKVSEMARRIEKYYAARYAMLEKDMADQSNVLSQGSTSQNAEMKKVLEKAAENVKNNKIAYLQILTLIE